MLQDNEDSLFCAAAAFALQATSFSVIPCCGECVVCCVCVWFLELNAFEHVLGIDTFRGITGEVPFDPLLLRRHFRCFDLLSIWDRGAPQESRGVPLTSPFSPQSLRLSRVSFEERAPFSQRPPRDTNPRGDLRVRHRF